MAIRHSLFLEFEHELALTRRAIERLREDTYDWAPHEKSWKAGQLVSHITELVGWGTMVMNQASFDLPRERLAFNAASQSELLAMFDKNAAECLEAIQNAGDEIFMQSWSMMRGLGVLFTMPRLAVMRTIVLHHIIHHRGQLTVYLRLTDTRVPSIYGPSADEGSFK